MTTFTTEVGDQQVEYVHVCSTCWIPSDQAWLYGQVPAAVTPCHRCGQTGGDCILHPHANEPQIVGNPLDFSTCVDLVLYPPIIWDTNRYYARLGVDPRATKAEIREAYIAKGGQDDERLTYIFKQLLDPEMRAAYDSTPLGALFFDYEIETAGRRVLADEVAKLRAMGLLDEAEELEQAIAEAFDAVVDSTDSTGHHKASHPGRTVWAWGYYTLMSGSQDTERLVEWRGLLIQALQGKGIDRLAVGFSRWTGVPWEVRRIGYRIVVFLSDDEQPTEAMAQAAADRVVHTAAQPIDILEGT